MGKFFLPTAALKLGFLDHGTSTILVWKILCCGGFLPFFGCLAEPLVLSAGCHWHIPSCNNPNCLRHCKCLLEVKNNPYLGTSDQNGILKYSPKNTLLSCLCDFAHLREFHFPRSIMSNSHHWPLGQTPIPPSSCIFPVERASPISNFKALYLYLLYDNSECQLCASLYKTHNNSTRRASLFMYTLETKARRICVTSQGHIAG